MVLVCRKGAGSEAAKPLRQIRTTSYHLTIHRGYELIVRISRLHVAHQELEGFFWLHVGQVVAKYEHTLEYVAVEQKVVAAGAGLGKVDARVHSLVGQEAVELELHVTSSFEFFEDNFVHFRTSINQSGRQDGQRAATIDVTSGTEEFLGLL